MADPLHVDVDNCIFKSVVVCGAVFFLMEPEPTFEGGSSFIPGPASTQKRFIKKVIFEIFDKSRLSKITVLPYGSTLGLC